MERRENLALAFQEILTAIVRLRANRQAVSDAESFRGHMRHALQIADQEGRKRGYSAEEIQLATFAVVAFLDESILNSRNPLFADWPRKPMQEELFGTHVAGELFFHNLQKLLGQNDSVNLADLLEVHNLCLLLGFGGRYSVGGKGELRAIMEATAGKIRRIRGQFSALSPAWAPPDEGPVVARSDPWMRHLIFTAAACLILALGLFAGFKLSLSSGASDLRAMASTSRN